MIQYRNPPEISHCLPEPYAYDDRIEEYLVRRGWDSSRAGSWLGRDQWAWPASRELAHPTTITLDGYGLQVQGASTADVADQETSTRFRLDDQSGLEGQIERIEDLHNQPAARKPPVSL